MKLHRLWAVVLGLWMIVTILTVWSKHSVTPSAQAIAQPLPITTSVMDDGARALPTRDQRDDEWAQPRVDLNGNEIDAAVSDYRVDPRGEMYERHAPDTALLHLGAPKI
jgi:hypothetical protein